MTNAATTAITGDVLAKEELPEHLALLADQLKAVAEHHDIEAKLPELRALLVDGLSFVDHLLNKDLAQTG